MAESSKNDAQFAFVCQLCDQKNVKWKCEECGIFLCSTCKEKIHPRIKASVKHRIVSIKDIWKDIEPWYHGKMTIEKAEWLLQKHKNMGNGSFLVRESANNIGNYSLDVLENNEIIHVRIFTKEESGHLQYFSGDDLVYDSLKEIISWFKNGSRMTTSLGDRFTLTEPVPKETKCNK